MLRDLESAEWGRPVALGTVFDEAMRKRSMIPLPVYKTTAGLLQKSQWRVIDSGVLSPWNVMSWGVRQLKGFVVGSESDSAPKLQVQELVLVENLQVYFLVEGLFLHLSLLTSSFSPTGNSRLGREEGYWQQFLETGSNILERKLC